MFPGSDAQLKVLSPAVEDLAGVGVFEMSVGACSTFPNSENSYISAFKCTNFPDFVKARVLEAFEDSCLPTILIDTTWTCGSGTPAPHSVGRTPRPTNKKADFQAKLPLAMNGKPGLQT